MIHVIAFHASNFTWINFIYKNKILCFCHSKMMSWDLSMLTNVAVLGFHCKYGTRHFSVLLWMDTWIASYISLLHVCTHNAEMNILERGSCTWSVFFHGISGWSWLFIGYVCIQFYSPQQLYKSRRNFKVKRVSWAFCPKVTNSQPVEPEKSA